LFTCNLVCGSEENVYMLCKKLSEVGLAAPTASDLFVVFISNPNRQVNFKTFTLSLEFDSSFTTFFSSCENSLFTTMATKTMTQNFDSH